MSVKYDMSKVEGLNDADKLRLISAYVNHPEPKNVRSLLRTKSYLLILSDRLGLRGS